MATSDKEQMGEGVRYHARMAMGAKLDGTSLQPKGGNTPQPKSNKPQGGLAILKKK